MGILVRLAGLAGASLALVFGGASAASAVNVGTQASPTGPPSTISLSSSVTPVAITLTGGKQIVCPMGVAGSVTAGSYATLPASVGSVQLVLSAGSGPCLGSSGGETYTLSCPSTSLSIVGPPSGIWYALTLVEWGAISCTLTAQWNPSCHATLTGSVPVGQYQNPLGSTAAKLMISASGVASSGTTCLTVLSNGPVTLMSAAGPLGAPIVFTLAGTGVNHPFIS